MVEATSVTVAPGSSAPRRSAPSRRTSSAQARGGRGQHDEVRSGDRVGGIDRRRVDDARGERQARALTRGRPRARGGPTGPADRRRGRARSSHRSARDRAMRRAWARLSRLDPVARALGPVATPVPVATPARVPGHPATGVRPSAGVRPRRRQAIGQPPLSGSGAAGPDGPTGAAPRCRPAPRDRRPGSGAALAALGRPPVRGPAARRSADSAAPPRAGRPAATPCRSGGRRCGRRAWARAHPTARQTARQASCGTGRVPAESA